MQEDKGKELADFFEDSFRALKPDRLGGSILLLCRDLVRDGRERVGAELAAEVAEAVK